MTSGDYTLTNRGVFNISGSALKTAVDAINIPAAAFISGSRVEIVNVGHGQVLVLEMEVEG